MAATRPTPTGRESPLGEDEIIVTKTDIRGRITYANEVFLRVSVLTWTDAIGAPHSLVRHPAMPRCVFELMWKTIQSGGEFFGYVLNLATNGDHYWVFAHVTPSFGPDGAVVGFHSNRRKPEPRQVASISALYRDLLAVEQREEDRKRGQQMGAAALAAMLAEKEMSYDRFAFAL
ncbi:PAS domain-containing protein [Neoroseomonas rubea]|uniref:PAS domain-containing protein n=1 Tax=Neoroseomonas rubea TaxID=2748666 RepID=UPI0018E05744|nr:PAS domain-containing protein [Roseomonas rubea]